MTNLNLQGTLPTIEPIHETPLTLRAATVSEIAAEVVRLSALGKRVEIYLSGDYFMVTFVPDDFSYFGYLSDPSDQIDTTLEDILRRLYRLGNAQQGQPS